jgi:hypothetical protein
MTDLTPNEIAGMVATLRQLADARRRELAEARKQARREALEEVANYFDSIKAEALWAGGVALTIRQWDIAAELRRMAEEGE